MILNNTKAIKSGRWETKGGSCLLIEVSPSGLVSGEYSTSHGRPETDERFPVTGWVNHDLISLCCSWQKYRSMTTWCGRYYNADNQETIKYMWHLAREFEDKELTRKNDITFTFHTMNGEFIYKGGL